MGARRYCVLLSCLVASCGKGDSGSPAPTEERAPAAAAETEQPPRAAPPKNAEPADVADANTEVTQEPWTTAFSLAPLLGSTKQPKKKTISLQLRSTPTGAEVKLDGVPIGETPILWSGVPSETPRVFAFSLPGFRTSRYRFIPTHSGVVHGSLAPEKSAPADAGRSVAPTSVDDKN